MRCEAIEWGGIYQINELGNIDQYLKCGLIALVLCEFGLGRSPDLAKELSRHGKNSLYLERGMHNLARMNPINQMFAIRYIKRAPERIVVLSDEVYDEYRDLIRKLRAEFVRDRERGQGGQ